MEISKQPRVTRIPMLSLAVLIVAMIGLPIPGVPPPQNVLKGAAIQEASKALGVTLTEEAPLRSSAGAVYPTVPVLPGAAFQAGSAGRVQVAQDGSITLGPGDYRLTTQVFCMQAHAHSPSSNVFRLAPLQGKWADIIAAVQTRGTLAGLPHSDLQMLSWQLQAGLKYEELSPRSRALVDRLIPEFRSRIAQSYLEKIQSTWNRFASRIPGVPSLDSMLDQLGDAGRAIREIEWERNTLISYQSDYQYVARLFVPTGGGAQSREDPSKSPWSILGAGVYARLLNPGDYRGPGALEIRVSAGTASNVRLVIAATTLRGLGGTLVSQTGGVPGGMVGVPGAAVQPMGVAPEAPTPGPSPSPTSSPSCNTPPFGSGVDGVPNGKTTHPFHPENHPGTDVFAPRDTPVYADVQPELPVDDLNNSPLFHANGNLSLPETGNLKLLDATVTLQPWAGQGAWDWGGIVRLTLRYQGGSGAIYPINLEYLHLITKNRHPRNDANEWIDNKGKTIGPDDYKGCLGFGDEMQNGAKLTADQLGQHPLIGYEGATQTPHTHIQAWYGANGHNNYFDPQPLLLSN
jgi:hypothetical protein